MSRASTALGVAPGLSAQGKGLDFWSKGLFGGTAYG
jgi:hypothetical protein